MQLGVDLALCACGCGGSIPPLKRPVRRAGRVVALLDTPSSAQYLLGHRAHSRPQAQWSGRTPTYRSWDAMIQRCTNSNRDNWVRYGGRGITVCDEWLDSFEVFLADMGERPEGMSLDRIDPDGNYEPGNCRWATPEIQATNKSSKSCVPPAFDLY